MGNVITDNEKQEFLIAFGNRVRQLRTERKMSLDELARKCGYISDNARSSIQKIEAGKSDIPASKIRLISKALEVPISFIMGWSEEWDELRDTGQMGKISKSEFEAYIKAEYGDTSLEALSLYSRLDLDDKGEIRGEMKQMLKHDKYTAQKELSNRKAM